MAKGSGEGVGAHTATGAHTGASPTYTVAGQTVSSRISIPASVVQAQAYEAGAARAMATGHPNQAAALYQTASAIGGSQPVQQVQGRTTFTPYAAGSSITVAQTPTGGTKLSAPAGFQFAVQSPSGSTINMGASVTYGAGEPLTTGLGLANAQGQFLPLSTLASGATAFVMPSHLSAIQQKADSTNSPQYDYTTNQLVLPKGWTIDKSGNLTINGIQPTLENANSYAQAVLQYAQANQNTYANPLHPVAQTAPTAEPNWYQLLANSSSGISGITLANLAATGLGPLSYATPVSQAYYGGAAGALAIPTISGIGALLAQQPSVQTTRSLLRTPTLSNMPITEILNSLSPGLLQNVEGRISPISQSAQGLSTIAPRTGVIPQIANYLLNSRILQNALEPYLTTERQDIINFALNNPITGKAQPTSLLYQYAPGLTPQQKAFNDLVAETNQQALAQEIQYYSNPKNLQAYNLQAQGYNLPPINPYEVALRIHQQALAFPSALQNVIANVGSDINALYGRPIVPKLLTTYSPQGQIFTRYMGTQLPQEEQAFLSQSIPQKYQILPQAVGAVITAPQRALAGLTQEHATPLSQLGNVLTLAGTAIAPEATYLSGLGMGGLNVLTGGKFQPGYQYGTELALPLEGAEALGAALLPESLETAPLLSRAGLGRLLLTSAPTSALFAGMQGGGALMAGKTPQQVLESALEGYGLGVGLTAAPEFAGRAFNFLRNYPFGLQTDIKTLSLENPQLANEIILRVKNANPELESLTNEQIISQVPTSQWNRILRTYYQGIFNRLMGRLSTEELFTPSSAMQAQLKEAGITLSPSGTVPVYGRNELGEIVKIMDVPINEALTYGKYLETPFLKQGAPETLPVVLPSELAQRSLPEGMPFTSVTYPITSLENFISMAKTPAELEQRVQELTLSDNPTARAFGKTWQGILEGMPVSYIRGVATEPTATRTLFDYLTGKMAQYKPLFTFESLQGALSPIEKVAQEIAPEDIGSEISKLAQITGALPALPGTPPTISTLPSALGGIATPAPSSTPSPAGGQAYVMTPGGQVQVERTTTPPTYYPGGQVQVERTTTPPTYYPGGQVQVERIPQIYYPPSLKPITEEVQGLKPITEEVQGLKPITEEVQGLKPITVGEEKYYIPQPPVLTYPYIEKTKTIPLEKEIQQELQKTTTPPPSPPSLPPSPPSTPPPKKLPRIPNLPTLPQWFSAQEAALASMPAPQYTAQYSPSLLALLSPEINKLALQNYSPLQALSGVRPIMPSNPATYNYYNNHPTQALTAIENVPGTPNYQSAQSAPARAIMPTYAQSANPLRSTFSSAPASSQVSAVIDPATLQKVMNAAYPISLGSLPAGTQGGIFTQNNALLNSLKNLNQNELANYLAKTTPEQPQQSQFASAPFKMPTINGISIMPSAQDIISALGVKQTLSLLSKINPVKFNIANLEKATPAELANALQNLSYSDITLLMAEMPMMDRIQVYMLLGIPYAEAYLLAQNVNPQMFPTLSNALAGTTRKRIISAPSAEPELARAITI